MDKNIIEELLEQTRVSKRETEKLSQIDEAAITLFAERGFANTSTKAIAAKANVAEGTIFKHYKTKEHLLLSILLKFINIMLPVMKKEIFSKLNAQSFPTFESLMRFFILNRLTFVRKNHDVFKVFVKELIYNDALRADLLKAHSGDITRFFYEQFDHYKKSGQIKPIDNAILMRRFLKVVLMDFILVFALSEAYQNLNEEEWISQLIDSYLEGIRA